MSDDHQLAELHHKMSKKIAQLTKVIYQLNCRTEDNDSTMQAMSDRYETEIADVVSDARAKLVAMKEQLDSKREAENLTKAVKELNRQHAAEKAEAMRMFEDFKAKVRQADAETKQAADEKISTMARELNSIKEEFGAKIVELRESSAGIQRSSSEEVEALRKRKDQEINELVVQYNEKYKAMLSQQMQEQEEMRTALNAQWSKKMEAQSTEWAKVETDLQQQLSDAKAKGTAAGERVAALEQEVVKLNRSLVEAQTETARLGDKEVQLNTRLQTVLRELDEAEERIKTLTSKSSNLSDSSSALEKQNAALGVQIKQLQDTVSRHTETMSDQAATISTLEMEHKKTTAELVAAEDKVKSLTNAKLSLQEELFELEKRLEVLKCDMRTLEQRAQEGADTSSEAARKLATAERRIRELEEAQRQAEKDAKEHLARVNDEWAKKLARLNEDSSSDVATLRNQHDAALAQMKADLEAEHATIVAGLQANFDGKEKDLTATIAKLTAQLRDIESSASRSAADQSDQLAKLQAKLADTNSTLDEKAADLKASLERIKQMEAAHRAEKEAIMAEMDGIKRSASSGEHELTGRIASLESDVRRLGGDVTSRDGIIDDVKRQNTDLNAKLVAKEDELSKLRMAHIQELEELAKRHSSSLEATQGLKDKQAAERMGEALAELERTLREKHKRELEEQAAVEASTRKRIDDAHKDVVADLQATVAALRKELADAAAHTQGLSEQSRKSAEEAGNQMELQRARHEDEMQRLRSDLEAKFRDREAQLAAEHKSHEAMLTASLEGQLKTQAEHHDQHLQRLSADARSAQQDIEEAAKNRLASLEKRLTEERAAALKETQERLSGEMQRAREQHEKELEHTQKQMLDLEKHYRDANQRIQDLEGMTRTLESKLKDEKNQHESTRQLVMRAREEGAQTLENMTRKLREEHERQVRQKQASHDETVARMEQATEKLKESLNLRLQHMQKTIADLEYKYANRESRSEDVAKINELLKDIKAKEEALIKAYNDLKWYKLELVNREESYNKVFGRQPTVSDGHAATPPEGGLKSGAGGKPAADMAGRRTRSIAGADLGGIGGPLTSNRGGGDASMGRTASMPHRPPK